MAIALGSNDDSTDYDEVSIRGGLGGGKYSTISAVNTEALSPRFNPIDKILNSFALSKDPSNFIKKDRYARDPV